MGIGPQARGGQLRRRHDATPVTEDYKAYDEFTGKILKVTVKVKEMGAGVKAQAAKAGADAAKELAAAK